MAGERFGNTFSKIISGILHYIVNFCILFSYKLEVKNWLVLTQYFKPVMHQINFKLSEIFKTQSTSKYIFQCYYLKIILISVFLKVGYILDLSNINKHISPKKAIRSRGHCWQDWVMGRLFMISVICEYTWQILYWFITSNIAYINHCFSDLEET